MALLPRMFYARNTRVVAIELLGKVLSVPCGARTLTARIVEVEAYFGEADPASHAARGMTPRNKVMFGPPGFTYVYFIYGNHYCLNVVTETEGVPGAVLIRAVEPFSGVRTMLRRRRVKDAVHVSNGPGKLTEALGISGRHSGCDLVFGDIVIMDEEKEADDDLYVVASPRIGIRKGKEFLYRFYIKDNKYVTPIRRRAHEVKKTV